METRYSGNMEKYGLIILAAGSSNRLGRPKQLLQFRKKSLLRHIIDEAIATGYPVVLVIGANGDLISREFNNTPVSIVENKGWEQGMGTSIRKGLEGMLALFPDLDGVLFLADDQPFVSSAMLNALMAQKKASGKGIIACGYAHTSGIPVMFGKRYFSALLALQGAAGAKKILQEYGDDLLIVPFPLGEMDIDTAEDYDRLLKKNWPDDGRPEEQIYG
ncbi:MAG TPA: nucleotidyltransferase family protein [Chitinophagaceae bacterium]|nr:nucleotidyltransferase family protein [Chitinophagaceae bacterium]